IAAVSTTSLPATANDAAGTYKLDRAHASLVWKVNHLGLSFYTARFDTFDATLDINPDEARVRSVQLVSAGSIIGGRWQAGRRYGCDGREAKCQCGFEHRLHLQLAARGRRGR
ncbi:MAG: YceI family protein, partial [Pseudomonadota bacterium]